MPASIRHLVISGALLSILCACGQKATPLVPSAPGATYSYKPERLSSFRITGVALDDKDLAWVGTDGTLATFDGTNLRTFSALEGENRLHSEDIRCVFSDRESTVWIGTPKGLYTYARYNQFREYTDPYGRTVPVSQITQTSDGVLLVASETGLYRLNEEMTLAPIRSANSFDGPDIQLIPDDDGGVWVLTLEATVHYNRSFDEINRFEAAVSAIPNLGAARSRDKLWALQGRELSCFDLRAGTRDYTVRLDIFPVTFIAYDEPYLLIKSLRYGLQAFDPASRTIVPAALPYIPTTPPRSDISCLTQDRLGNLWIGYEHYGLLCVSKMQRRLQELNSGALHQATRGEYIRSLKRAAKGTLWGSFGQSVFRYQPDRDVLDVFEVSSLMGEDTGVSRIDTDGQDDLWLIGYDKIGTGEASPAGRLKIGHTRETGFRIGQSAAIDGTCYFTADAPFLFSYDRDGHLDSLRIDGSTAPYYDRNAKVLPVGRNNLLIICSGMACTLVHPDQGTSEPMTIHNGAFNKEEKVIDAVLDGQTVWLAPGHGGLFAMDLGSGDVDEVPELSGQVISGLIKFSDRSLAFGTSSGVFFYDLTDRTLRNFKLQLGRNSISSYTPAGTLREANNLIMGTNNGCIIVPADIPMNADSHYVSVQRVRAHSKDGAAIISLPVGEGTAVLDHRHNSVEIHYGFVSYDDQPVKVEYLLEGYNTSWIASNDRERTAYYEKLDAGRYVFRIREVQPFTDKVLEERSMTLLVRQSPWKTVPAFLLYFLFGAGLIAAVIYTWLKVRDNKMKLSVAEERHELERRTNQMNMSFFANIAHEFRNPLTIISGPLGSLAHDPSLSESAQKKVTAISESANTMLRLIDQMLDFNQLEMDVLRLCVGERDIPYELSRMVEIYRESAEPRGIRIETSGLDEPFVTTVDMDKIDKIVSNLYTNALKHTPDGGVIGIRFDTVSKEEASADFPEAELGSSNYFLVNVTNNGRTIPEDKLPNVFLRYYQSSETTENHDYGWGRGIGLYYVKQLVRIHGGAIRVFNLANGVCFSFIIPTDGSFYEGVERENQNVHRILQIDVPRKDHLETKAPAPVLTESRPTLLVVDDDIQVGSYLRMIFEDSYHVVNRYSAEAALPELETINPDLIISDVVMGKMSGYEFCRNVKSDLMFSHIPFILLTAKTNVEDSVAGLECGANAYVSKPFSAEYLTALVSSLLRNVEHVRSFLNAHTDDGSIEDGVMGEQDRRFMHDLYALMEKHLSDADLNVTSVCEELRISRSKFNYKLKGLTGSSPGTFFRHYKLNRAAKLLKEGKYNVSEIADMMGFSSISNFSVSFKKMFGVAPRDYQ